MKPLIQAVISFVPAVISFVPAARQDIRTRDYVRSGVFGTAAKQDIRTRGYSRSMSTQNSIIDTFMESFYGLLRDKASHGNYNPTNVSKYQEEVFNILHHNKPTEGGILKDDELMELQFHIEEITTHYVDVQSLYKIAPDLLNKLIRKDQETAKEFLKKHLSPESVAIINQFDHYTLEAIMIHVLATVFHSVKDYPIVRLSTLIEQLDSVFRVHADLLKRRLLEIYDNSVSTDNPGKLKQGQRTLYEKQYGYGILMGEFLESRELITINTGGNLNEASLPSKKKGGRWYTPKTHYVYCNFDLSLLPIKLNLPMVSPPLPWASNVENPRTLSELVGGYYTAPSSDFYYNSFRLLTSNDSDHYNIILKGHCYNELCDTMNILQSQAFIVNTAVLNLIENHYDKFVESGLLMPKFLASLNLKESTDLLRMAYFQDPSVKKVCKYDIILREFMSRVQRSRFESFILKLASAYDGYKFYLPAFIDFRGRIYRSGLLHFHERDLARSLILFADFQIPDQLSTDKVHEAAVKAIATASSFHYKKFFSNDEASDWYVANVKKNFTVRNKEEEELINYAVSARHPFQFISTVLCLEFRRINPLLHPVTQDASASAYQLISYFLLNKELAMHTNLIPTGDGIRIHDVYNFYLEELRVYLQKELSTDLSSIVCPQLTRELAKKIFMPLVYGKSIIGISSDINDHFNTIISRKESYNVAALCNKFWRNRFPGIEILIVLINTVAWFAVSMDLPVFYRIPMFTSVQDYMKTKPVNLWVYDRLRKKKRQVTLRVTTSKRDRRKTMAATFVNFIHQKDAGLALYTAQKMHEFQILPVYTVHDNFITTACNVRHVALIYSSTFAKYNPLIIINWFITKNLLAPSDSLFCTEDGPIPEGAIKRVLMSKMPPNDIKTWEPKIMLLEEAYKQYVHIICPNPYGLYNMPPDIDSKWVDFNKSIREWDYFKYNNSLHY